MAIEFFCSHCGQLVRTADAAAGRKGQCPSCQAVVMVPEGNASAPPPPSNSAVIECDCPQCGQIVRAPASAAGKRGQCPQCQSLLTVPARSTVSTAPVPAAAGGLVEIQDPWSDLPPVGSQHGVSPFAQPATTQALADPADGEEPPPEPMQPAWVAIMERARAEERVRDGLAWDRDATLGSMFDTTFQLCSSGGVGFDDMAVRGGYSNPLTFFVFAVFVNHVAGIALRVGLYLLAALLQRELGNVDWIGLLQLVCFLGVFAAIISLFGATLSAFLSSWCTHLVLQLFGRLRYGYEATFRVMCYSGGANYMLGATIVFSPLMLVFAFLLPIWGLARVHGIPVWQSIIAFLLGIFLTGILIVGLSVALYIFVISALITSFNLQQYFGR